MKRIFNAINWPAVGDKIYGLILEACYMAVLIVIGAAMALSYGYQIWK